MGNKLALYFFGAIALFLFLSITTQSGNTFSQKTIYFNAHTIMQHPNDSVNASTFNYTLANIANIINTINQSGYLIFYPNLTSAYFYLNASKNKSRTNYSIAYSYLLRAKNSAQQAQVQLGRYQYISILVSILLIAVLFVIIYMLMIPKKQYTYKGSSLKNRRLIKK